MSKERLLRLIKKLEPSIKRQDIFRRDGVWYWITDKGAVVLGRPLGVAMARVKSHVEK